MASTDPKTSLKIDFRKKNLRGKFLGGHFFWGGAFLASTDPKTSLKIDFRRKNLGGKFFGGSFFGGLFWHLRTLKRL